MKIIWLSANKFGYETFDTFITNVRKGNDVSVMTLSHEGHERTRQYDKVAPERWLQTGVFVKVIENINEETEYIRLQKPDLIIVAGWRQLIKKDVLDMPKYGVIGFHPTLLPYGRGKAPIINTILRGDTESGVTMFFVGEGLDDGDIIAQERFSIADSDHAGDVYEKVVSAGRRLIAKYLVSMVWGGRINRDCARKQGRAYVEFGKPVETNEILIGELWKNGGYIYRKIKALSRPYDGAFIKFQDGKKLIIWEAELVDE